MHTLKTQLRLKVLNVATGLRATYPTVSSKWSSLANPQVPQGSILGPLLFSVFIDDLGDECENILYLYADDFTLFCEIIYQVMTASLNMDLERMRNWADKWKVTFEPSKCKALTISRKRNPTWSDLFCGNTKLAENELEILGVTVDRKLTWAKHISIITARAGQNLGAGLRKVANKLDVKGRATVYKAQVCSVMEYASLCWMSASTTTL